MPRCGPRFGAGGRKADVLLDAGRSAKGYRHDGREQGSRGREKKAAKQFTDENRWPLAKQYLDRADHSANIIRGFLFSAATGAIGFIVHEAQPRMLHLHLLPLILLGGGAALVVFSWDIQKGKAKRRFDALRDGEDFPTERWHNYILDRISGGLIRAECRIVSAR